MGIYVHVPFCRSKCYYCGFYSLASSSWKKEYVEALVREIRMRKNYLGGEPVRTLYFGGGTPSWLAADELEAIVAALEEHFGLGAVTEQTLEANPEDVVTEKLRLWKDLGFNRLSMGIQSFNEEVLRRMNRAHSSQQAIQAVERAARCGFENISIDLMIGFPGDDCRNWQEELKEVNYLPVSHVSVYMLSIDSNTVFEKLWRKGQFKPLDEDAMADQYLWVSGYLKSIGFEHYEISNFAKNSKYSVHNTSYWQQKKYIGFGPAAHSFDLVSRQWNVAHLKNYIDALNRGCLDFEKELLTEKDQYNEYLMTNLRTRWGISPAYLQARFPEFWKTAVSKWPLYEKNGWVRTDERRICLTEKGWLVSDELFRELFII